jgi:hypothetical protein
MITGLSETPSSSSYSARICRQSVSSARRASSWTAAMAASSWYGPSGDRDIAPVTGAVALLDGRAVLLGQRNQRAVRPGARRKPRLGQQHQREQPGDLAVARQQAVHGPGEPDGLPGQVTALQVGACGRGVALVEKIR